jgi:hypothetical protein
MYDAVYDNVVLVSACDNAVRCDVCAAQVLGVVYDNVLAQVCNNTHNVMTIRYNNHLLYKLHNYLTKNIEMQTKYI